MNWKAAIIEMTQFPEAREGRFDATFFPPVSEDDLSAWQVENEVVLPEEWSSFYRQSNGMEATKGEWFPVLALEDCVVLPTSCSREAPWVEFGKIGSVRYFLNTALDRSVFRLEEFESEPEFFCTGLQGYFEKVFRGKAL